jgi:predicted MPP superfamily phosphohydrolase
MKPLSPVWHKRMAAHLGHHRQRINEIGLFAPEVRVRHFSGHALHAEQLTTPIRVAHLTDQHVGRVTPLKTQNKAVDLALAQDPDVVLLTGDFVCHSELYLDDLTELIRRINKPAFAVLGNHDHWTNAEAVKKALIKGGAEILTNANTLITVGHETLQLVGVDDAYTGHADLNQAIKGMKKNIATIGLSHIPEEADKFWLKGIPLVLSGHTHAGQVTVAGLHELILGKVVGHKYIHGFYGSRSEGIPQGAVYVSAGIGAAVMPLRMGEKGKREVAIFDIGKPLPNE